MLPHYTFSTRYLASATPAAALARLREISNKPEIMAALLLAGEAREAQWLHVFGPSVDDGLRALLPPIAPLELRSIVNAGDEVLFLWNSTVHLDFLMSIHEAHAEKRPPPLRILDFGCGCGRLTRLLAMSPDHKVCGSEANPRHVEWCSANLRGATFRQNGPRPPLDFAEASFDLVLAWSVFSHLPKERAREWFIELARVLSPDGLLLFTTHGPTALASLTWSPELRAVVGFDEHKARAVAAEMNTSGYAFEPYAEDVVRLANAGEGYGLAFADMLREQALWNDCFRLLAHAPGGPHKMWQDVLALRKRG